MKAIFIPGNGGGHTDKNWFPYLNTELRKLGIEIVAAKFPDPVLARRSYWIPFLERLGADENTILIGHSSGALAGMRYVETHSILGSILVGVCHTDLGLESERLSGYYDEPWDWDAIKMNQKWIAIFASMDDPFIPVDESRYVRDQLSATYFEFTDRGHFITDHNPANRELPEAFEFLKSETRKVH